MFHAGTGIVGVGAGSLPGEADVFHEDGLVRLAEIAGGEGSFEEEFGSRFAEPAVTDRAAVMAPENNSRQTGAWSCAIASASALLPPARSDPSFCSDSMACSRINWRSPGNFVRPCWTTASARAAASRAPPVSRNE